MQYHSKHHHNAPNTMGHVLVTSSIRCHGTGPTTTYNYLRNLFNSINAGQTGFARYDSNTHIRRRQPGDSSQTDYVDFPDVWFDSRNIDYYNDAQYHRDHSESHTP